MADEPNLTGNFTQGEGGQSMMGKIKSSLNISLPQVGKVTKDVQDLVSSLSGLKNVLSSLVDKGYARKLGDQLKYVSQITKEIKGPLKDLLNGFNSGGSRGFGGSQSTVFEAQGRKSPADSVKIDNATTAPTAKIPTAPSSPTTTQTPPKTVIPPLEKTSAGSADAKLGSSEGRSISQGFASLGGNLIKGVLDLYGGVTSSGIQYIYNRINGPSGNANGMLQFAQALAPNVTMMNAAGVDVSMNGFLSRLAKRTPIMGNQQDILQTILAGQSVGALMEGTPGRNGFFESARQMQVLNPGQAPATISGTLASYISNTQSQKMGAFLGEGAFTMIGQGGRYKSLAEWAHGITEFFKQNRPGSDRGKSFSKGELIAQNFPGSNINAWFQMMGVPQNMVDYWWQYVLTSEKGALDEVTSKTLNASVEKARGVNLGYEQLRTATQGARREFIFGNNMYLPYGAQIAANRRFNTAMQGTDRSLAQELRKTNLGQAISMLPTPIMEMLLPLFTTVASSPVGAAASGLGWMFGDPMPYGDPAGSYGATGGTTTAHLSPDLAKRVSAMMRANPNLRISSGYRDTVTQNRLRRNGVSTVGHPSKSAHTRGWAVDIGPSSQMGWLAANAGKFGLQTAASFGEPWHIQMAGSLVGDPMSRSSMPLGDAPDEETGNKIKNIISGFINNDMAAMLDKAIAFFSRIITSPFVGLAKLFGDSDATSNADYRRLINQSGNVTVPVVAWKGGGFDSDPEMVADPYPYGNPQELLTRTPSGRTVSQNGPTIVFNSPITIQGGAGGLDTRQVAISLIDRLEEEANKRSWLVT